MNIFHVKSINRFARILRSVYRPVRNKKNLKFINSEVLKRFDKLHQTEIKNSLILDLGANRGDFSKWALDQGATVIAFEPDKDAYLQLIKRLNKFENFFPLNSAVSNKTGLGKFYFHKNKKIDPIGFSISSSLLENKPNIDNSFFNSVLCIDLEVLIKELPIKLIKIDIEGAEALIWPTIKQNYQNIEYLLLEIHKTIDKDLTSEIKLFIEQNGLQNKWRTDWL
jgi:FkbM family methyltransferase